jgi:uncharacterized protein YecE (DUF72 family)
MATAFKAGVAGWDYKNWNGTVYPERPGRNFDKLEYLSLYLPLFEINRTYYRAATAAEARSWVERVAHRPDVVFTAKIPEQFVAPGKSWTREDVAAAREGLDVLHEAGRLGAAVLQFAYSFKRIKRDHTIDEDALKWLLRAAGAFKGLPVFVEFRHDSWDAPEVLAELRERKIGWVAVDQPHLPKDSLRLRPYATTSTGYIRMHGRNYQTWMRFFGRGSKKTAENVEKRQKKTPEQRRAEEDQKNARFDYLYTRHELEDIARTAREIARQPEVREVYAVNNNHNFGKAPTNALMLESMLSGVDLPAPPDLFEEYPEALKDFAHPVPAEELRLKEGSPAKPSQRELPSGSGEQR